MLINVTRESVLPLQLSVEVCSGSGRPCTMIRLTPDMMAEGAGCQEGDSPACSAEEPNNTPTPRAKLRFSFNALEQKGKTPRSGQVYVRLIDPKNAVCVADKSSLRAAEISLLARVLAEAAKRNPYLLFMSARRVYSQNIICVGLFKHCKRIHSIVMSGNKKEKKHAFYL